MIVKTFFFFVAGTLHIVVGFMFYKLRVTYPGGVMRHDFFAFILPFLFAALAYYLIIRDVPAFDDWAVATRVFATLFFALGSALVSQIIAMTIAANLYGT